jgi:hypothetical protein
MPVPAAFCIRQAAPSLRRKDVCSIAVEPGVGAFAAQFSSVLSLLAQRSTSL